MAEAVDSLEEPVCSRKGKSFTFSLASEDYGMGILKIKEIIGTMPITSVAGTSDFVKGIINLRRKVMPAMSVGVEVTDYHYTVLEK